MLTNFTEKKLKNFNRRNAQNTKNMKQTIDIHTYTWFDKLHGKTSFAQKIVLNYGTDQEQTYVNKFQYGHGSFYEYALKFLRTQGVVIPEHYNELRGMFILRNHEQRVKKSFFNANGLN